MIQPTAPMTLNEAKRVVLHLRNAGDNGGERPGERHELCHDDRDRSVLLVKFLCLQQMPPLEKPRLFPCVQRMSPLLADKIARRVSKNCSGNQQEDQHRDVEKSGGREQAGSDEKRIAGQKEPDEESGFREDDQRQPRIAGPPDQLLDVCNFLEKFSNDIHRHFGFAFDDCRMANYRTPSTVRGSLFELRHPPFVNFRRPSRAAALQVRYDKK